MPEEAVSTGKVRSLGMTGRVENVPLPPSLTLTGRWQPLHGRRVTAYSITSSARARSVAVFFWAHPKLK